MSPNLKTSYSVHQLLGLNGSKGKVNLGGHIQKLGVWSRGYEISLPHKIGSTADCRQLSFYQCLVVLQLCSLLFLLDR